MAERAPMLFGKRMRAMGDAIWSSERIGELGSVVIYKNRTGKFTASASHRGFSPYFMNIELDSPEAAAKEAEEFLIGLYNALGRVIDG